MRTCCYLNVQTVKIHPRSPACSSFRIFVSACSISIFVACWLYSSLYGNSPSALWLHFTELDSLKSRAITGWNNPPVDSIPGYKGIRVHYGCISHSLILKRGGFREKPSYICMKQSDLKHMLVFFLNWELNSLSELQRANRWTDNTRPSSLCRQRLDLCL